MCGICTLFVRGLSCGLFGSIDAPAGSGLSAVSFFPGVTGLTSSFFSGSAMCRHLRCLLSFGMVPVDLRRLPLTRMVSAGHLPLSDMVPAEQRTSGVPLSRLGMAKLWLPQIQCAATTSTDVLQSSTKLMVTKTASSWQYGSYLQCNMVRTNY